MASPSPTVRPVTDHETAWRRSILEQGWGSTEVARLGQLIDATGLPGFVAELEGRRAGLATFALRSDGMEVVTIQSLVEGRGVGRALMDRLRSEAATAGARRLWLITTNDNVRAFEFYQRWGMDLVRVVPGGVKRSRRVKPGIPATAANGIELRHELEFELPLGPPPTPPEPGPLPPPDLA